MGYYVILWIFPKSSQRRGARGCRILDIRDLDSRNERIRIIAFQNIQNFSNQLSKNIFSARRKLEKISKFSKIRSDLMKISLEIWENWSKSVQTQISQQSVIMEILRYKKC